MRPAFRITLALLGLAAVAFTWNHISQVGGRGARARHMEEGRAYAARTAELVGTVPRVLYESSGVAVSRQYPGVLWTHNDDPGTPPLMYAIDIRGQVLGAFKVTGAPAGDWEDVSLGPCPTVFESDSTCLFIGDIGDNERIRSLYGIVVVPEPDPAIVDSNETAVLTGARRIDFRYPDGRHDAEAMAVGGDGNVIIVTKGRNGHFQVFQISAGGLDSAIQQHATIVPATLDTLPMQPVWQIGRMVTGAAFSPLGSTLAVRTYSEIYFFNKGSDGKFVDKGSPCFLGAIEPLGEAVDYLDEQTLVVTSEWSRTQEGTIYRVRC